MVQHPFHSRDGLQHCPSGRFGGIGTAEYHFLIERHTDGIIVVDGEGIVLFANSAAAGIFGRPIGSLIGQPIGLPLSEGETTEIVVLRPGGGRADVEMRVMTTTWDGRAGLLASLRDISAQREMEERQRQSHKMEAMGRLTAGVTHDFNNLLTVVIGNLEFVQRLANANDSKQISRYAESAMQGARRAAALTEKLLTFARRQPVSPQAVDINRLLQGMTDLLSRTLGESIRIESQLSDQLSTVLVDPSQLEAAILNLAVNARDAMPNGGTLTLETTQTTFANDATHEVSQKPCVRVTVRDSGCGMSDEVLTNVFEPFFTTKEVGRGTGLGLSQVYGFITQSGGVIRIDSKLGNGTAVHLYLPLTDSQLYENTADEAAKSAAPGARHGAIVVAEDNDDVRSYIVGALRALGYHVLEAVDAQSALDAVDRTPDVRLLFSDIDLPGNMNGRQLADIVRSRHPDVQILLTTGHAGGTVLKEGQLEPRLHLLVKPFTYAALASKVDLLLAAPRQEPTVLLVEDDNLVRMTILQVLLDAGCRVEEAANASEAVEKIHSSHIHIDAAVIDLGLPDGHGGALAAELRAARPSVPILIASGYGASGTGEIPEGEGIAFLEKPFDGEQLCRILTSLGVLGA